MILREPVGFQNGGGHDIEHIPRQLRESLEQIYGTHGAAPIDDLVEIGGQALRVIIYGPNDDDYSVPIVVTGSHHIDDGRDGSISRVELSDLFGGDATYVPDGTPIVDASVFLPTGGYNFSPEITFSHKDDHGISVANNGNAQREQRYFDQQVKVKNLNGTRHPNDSWNTRDLPHLVDVETGAYGRDSGLILAVGPRFSYDISHQELALIRSGELQIGTQRPLDSCDMVYRLQLFQLPIPAQRPG